MFKIESYITPILLSYVDKYVKDFKPADAQVSLWGGGVALHNLVLKADVLQNEISLPFTLVSGRIHELLIHVPWTKIMSEPIVVTIDTIECILSLDPPAAADEGTAPETPSRKQALEAPPGYMQALVRRIVSNIALRIHHLIVKYVQDDIVLSLNVKHLGVDSAGSNWEAAFADIDQNEPVIRRLVSLDDLTLCLDRADSDGKIRFYQEPVLYRCKLDLRVLTRLASANTRRAILISVQLLSSKLAWGATYDQIQLLLRLIAERPVSSKPPTPAPNTNSLMNNSMRDLSGSITAEPLRSSSWSEWAWSWLPSWADREPGMDETPLPAAPVPIHLTAYLDDVSLVFKMLDSETARKRARPILEIKATHAAMKGYICNPITTRISIGTRTLSIFSVGKCCCGFADYNVVTEEPIMHLFGITSEEAKEEFTSEQMEKTWEWPTDHVIEVEEGEAIDEFYKPPIVDDEVKLQKMPAPDLVSEPDIKIPPADIKKEPDENREGLKDEFWQKMAPQIYISLSHERSHPEPYANPFENPPTDFEYSDWVEESLLKVAVKPMELRISMGLIHRIEALLKILQELPPQPKQEITKRTLTVEECESLSDNLPQKRIVIEITGMRIRTLPWDHNEKAFSVPVALDVDLPKSTIYIHGPLYPNRVCLAACQMPDDTGPLWQSSRLHVTVDMSGVTASLCAPAIKTKKICARLELRAVARVLLNKELFAERESVHLSYSVKVFETSLCGSLARLYAALEIPSSLWRQKMSLNLRSSSLAVDAINDENSVMLDFTLEDLLIRGYCTSNIVTHIILLQSAKAMNIHEHKRGSVKQAFLFSAPDGPRSAPCLRIAVQWCLVPLSYSIDYIGVWSEPTAVAIDPLFIAWLMYSPVWKYNVSQVSTAKMSNSKIFSTKKWNTTTSSSGKGASKSGGSGAELVHMRPRSLTSSGKVDEQPKPAEETKELRPWWMGDRAVALHERLRHLFVNIELGLILVYVTLTTASAVDCETIRDTMERHASNSQRVLTLSLGRLFAYSSTIKKKFWHEINHEGPSYLSKNEAQKESFPWKMTLADVSCYTLEVKTSTDKLGRDAINTSQLKVNLVATPRMIVDHFSSTVSLTVVTKTLIIKIKPVVVDLPPVVEKPNPEEEKTKYFKSGMSFKPTTLKEFIRGPSERKKKVIKDDTTEKKDKVLEPEVHKGPVISLGINIHADTPPMLCKLEPDQVHVVAASFHSFFHIIEILQRQPHSRSSLFAQSAQYRTVSDMGGFLTPSDTESEDESTHLVSIFEAPSASDVPQFEMKTFFWCQWVISRMTLVVSTYQVKLVFEIDNILSTVDIQSHYNQFKLKLETASVRYYERSSSEESLSSLIGRILEVREPLNPRDDNNFLTVTVTQARISNLPASWKEELHPKLLEGKSGIDNMWEIYATLAPLEVVLQPYIVKHLNSLFIAMSPRSLCPLEKIVETKSTDFQWPFCYVTAGGFRLIVTSETTESEMDDSFIFSVGRTTVNPHPENPICRRLAGSGTDVTWMSSNTGFEGHQYEINVQKVTLKTAQFQKIVEAETFQSASTGENPAVKWAKSTALPDFIPILHSVDIGCVIAPPLYVKGLLTSGPALEVNLLTDCSLEVGMHQVMMAHNVIKDLRESLESSDEWYLYDEETHGRCCIAFCTDLNKGRDSKDIQETIQEEEKETHIELKENSSVTLLLGQSKADSGFGTYASSTTSKSLRNQDYNLNPNSVKKTVSVYIPEEAAVDPIDYVEVYITMGNVELSLYAVDDGTPEIIALRPPNMDPVVEGTQLTKDAIDEDDKSNESVNEEAEKLRGSRSLTETLRPEKLDKRMILPVLNNARKHLGNLPLLHMILYQPNLYYWRNKSVQSLQVSLFNTWVGLGVGIQDWNVPIMTTAKGVIDPVTEIPPALATLKIIVPCATGTTSALRGSIQLDVERPVMLEVCVDRLNRLIGIWKLTEKKIIAPYFHPVVKPTHKEPVPPLMEIKRLLAANAIEIITVNMTQLGLSAVHSMAGWDSASLQIAVGMRPDRLLLRALFSALTVSTGPQGDARHVLMHPLMAGIEAEATWEVWRRAEGGALALEPTVRASIEFDFITLDLRPEDVTYLMAMIKSLGPIFENLDIGKNKSPESETIIKLNPSLEKRPSTSSLEATEEHYYKDDLRSGAFKIVSDAGLPMAYQVALHKNIVSWRYPHPRTITRLVAFPLPGQNEEIPCVLELFNSILNQWEKHMYFKIPVTDPIELLLFVPPPDAVFGVMWRYRVIGDSPEPTQQYEFNINKFRLRSDPWEPEQVTEECQSKVNSSVTAEELSGVIRVDSCFSPRLAPRIFVVTRVAHLMIHLHNLKPAFSNQRSRLEGFYVSRPLMRDHRVLRLSVCNTKAHAQLGSPAGLLLLANSTISSDIMECSTGTMDLLIEKFEIQGGVSKPNNAMARIRVAITRVHVALHVPRLKTLQSLARDWNDTINSFLNPSSNTEIVSHYYNVDAQSSDDVQEALEGRVSMWVHNDCASAIKIGQEGTDEVVPLGPGLILAYRWRNPSAKKRLRFALAGPDASWQWSKGIPFSHGTHKVYLHNLDPPGATKYSPKGLYLHTKVKELGSRKKMTISGRLVLANMLRFNLLYKVRARCLDTSQWQTVCSAEILSESFGNSVICEQDCEMTLKIKFNEGNCGWSGDIPLKECPKENVPWLVKVPCEGDTPYMSVWCRVVRACTNSRILATIWPLYVLYSHLPLDTDVLIVTESTSSTADMATIPPPLIQTAYGRGTCTHLLAPGTTAARHSLSFQYRNLECPVTREAIPLHYGVTDTSVFDKRTPVNCIDDVIEETTDWLKKTGCNAKSGWPYSIVTNHWEGKWEPALLQPKCDVTVRYTAIRAGGGCCLETQLCPVVLLCNAATIALTLRAHDAAPLCRLEPGAAISPPSAVLTKPFFISVELGRETFVSSELEVCGAELGRYGEPPPGKVAIDRAAQLAIYCNQKDVALLSIYYEIKQEINVLGLTTTYMVINRLKKSIWVSGIAVPCDCNDTIDINPSNYITVEPTKKESVYGSPLCQFRVQGRWRGSDPADLRLFACVVLNLESNLLPLPIRVGEPPYRRAFSLVDENNDSIPVVMAQVKHEGRWLISISPDPCPQFVIHNRTDTPITVAQPIRDVQEASTSKILVQPECKGTNWHAVIQSGAVRHYSTPTHCLRYPPDANAQPYRPTLVHLTFAKMNATSQEEPNWCEPIGTTDGEQLVQLNGDTIKLRVRSHPHSTCLEIREVDEHDISASDIRNRLFGAFSTSTTGPSLKISTPGLERVPGDEKLLRSDLKLSSSIESVESLTQWPIKSVTYKKSILSQRSFKIIGPREKDKEINEKDVKATGQLDPQSKHILAHTGPKITEESPTINKDHKATEQPDNQAIRKSIVPKGDAKMSVPSSTSDKGDKTIEKPGTGTKTISIVPPPNPKITATSPTKDIDHKTAVQPDTQTKRKITVPESDPKTTTSSRDEDGKTTVPPNTQKKSTLPEADPKVTVPQAGSTITYKSHTRNEDQKATDNQTKTKLIVLQDDAKMNVPSPTSGKDNKTATQPDKTLSAQSSSPAQLQTVTQTTNAPTPSVPTCMTSCQNSNCLHNNTCTIPVAQIPIGLAPLTQTPVDRTPDCQIAAGQSSVAQTPTGKPSDSQIPGGQTPDEQTLADHTSVAKQVTLSTVADNLSEHKGMISPSTVLLYNDSDLDDARESKPAFNSFHNTHSLAASRSFKEVTDPEWNESRCWSSCDRLRVFASAIVVDVAAECDSLPLIAVNLDRTALVVRSDVRTTLATISIGDMQVDNLQYDEGQFDFGVIATTRTPESKDIPDASEEMGKPLWNIFYNSEMFSPRLKDCRALIRLTNESWNVIHYKYKELTEVEVHFGPLSMYVEDAYVAAIVKLWRRTATRSASSVSAAVLEEQSISTPLRLRMLHIHPLDMTITLHTAVRMYIALDQSPLRLNSFKLLDVMTSTERLTHALTVHYLSAAILGAGWVVGGLELLGAPGALAARVGGARGGVRGVASAAAAALVRSLSSCAGSLARNLDLLAGDEEHARRAAAARRKPPPSLMAGLAAGITNFAINILGAVGGLAHHPLVGVAVGESESSTTALRRGLIGAFAKPLSATADLVAFAGHGLLTQTGWDPVPQPRSSIISEKESTGWRRDCVRWTFRLNELSAITGFQVLVEAARLELLLTHRFIVVADPELERIIEMIDLRYCSIGSYEGQIIQLIVTQRRTFKGVDSNRPATEDEDEAQANAAAMARVARYTGAGASTTNAETRVLPLLPAPGHAHSLHAALTTAIHNNKSSHFSML